MSKMTIKDCNVLVIERRMGADGRVWAEAEIQWERSDFISGQYIMAAEKKHDVNWPSPLMIQKKTDNGFLVLIHENSPLADLEMGDGLTVWGPCGRGLDIEENKSYAAICDGKGVLLLMPFLNALKGKCIGIYMTSHCEGSWKSQWENSSIPVFEAMTIEKIVQQERVRKAELILAAVPLETVSVWKKQQDSFLEKKTKIFTGVKIGCGLGACRGCYIHTQDNPQGIAVCQEGPYLSMDTIDYFRDQNFLTHFV